MRSSAAFRNSRSSSTALGVRSRATFAATFRAVWSGTPEPPARVISSVASPPIFPARGPRTFSREPTRCGAARHAAPPPHARPRRSSAARSSHSGGFFPRIVEQPQQPLTRGGPLLRRARFGKNDADRAHDGDRLPALPRIRPVERRHFLVPQPLARKHAQPLVMLLAGFRPFMRG